MIAYTCFGTNDLPRAIAFYDVLLAELGATRLMEFPRGMIWGTALDKPSFCVLTPFDGQAASVGNGSMVAVVAQSRAQVDAVHAKALALGGKDEGAPGQRFDGFYAGYFRDLDGNKLNVVYMGA